MYATEYTTAQNVIQYIYAVFNRHHWRASKSGLQIVYV
jgi:hypothetical protein